MPVKPTKYSDLINNLLNDMPDFIMDFVYNTGKSYATKLEYCRDAGIFLDFMVNYLPEHEGKTKKDITLEDLANVSVLDVQRYLGLYKQPDMPLSTAKRKRASLSRMYGYFVNIDKIKANPVLKTDPIKVPEKNVIFLTNDEQKLFLDTIRSGNGLEGDAAKKHYLYVVRDSAMFLLMLDTGLRVSEMLGTDLIDFDLEECSVSVIRKGGDKDTVYFSDECRTYLEDYFLDQKTKYRLEKQKDLHFPAFTTTTGKRLGVRAVEKLVKHYIEVCLPQRYSEITPHKLRSTYGTALYRETGDIYLVADVLGHKDVNTTRKHYAAQFEDSRKHAANVVTLREKVPEKKSDAPVSGISNKPDDKRNKKTDDEMIKKTNDKRNKNTDDRSNKKSEDD